MQPAKTSITLLFNAPAQYVIPIFQRGYVWQLEKQVAPLWTDLVDRAEEHLRREEILSTPAAGQLKPLHKHFLGSLVLTPVTNAFGRVHAYEVIDGQQRTTTLHLLLLAFREVLRKLDLSQPLSMLEALTRNPGPYSVETDHHKVWPTQAGRDDIRFLSSARGADEVCTQYPLKSGDEKKERPLLVQTYLYLYHAILAYLRGINTDSAVNEAKDTTYSDALIGSIRRAQVVPELVPGPVVPGRAEALYMALQDHVQIMTLTLDAEDDPQVIFETLNARGEPLLASDLIRNFVFLEATRKSRDVAALYAQYWQEFDEQIQAGNKVTSNRYWREKERQGRIVHPRIDLFFFHYVVLLRAEEIKVSHVFQGFKEWWQQGPRDLDKELGRIQQASLYFKELISPEGHGRIAEFARLFKAMDVSTFVPVYLRLREIYGPDAPELHQALTDLESYVVRRAVCGLTTKNYNRIALKLLESINATEEPYLGVRNYLRQLGGITQCWPTDQDFREAFLSRPVYAEMRVGKVCAILRAIELTMHGRRQETIPLPTDLTVEHVLPQGWEKYGHYLIPNMNDEQRASRNRILHTFGNLTLLTQSLNSSVSNGPFHSYKDKDDQVIDGKRRRIASNSLLRMNAYFQTLINSEWNEAAIDIRGSELFNIAVKLWQLPSVSVVGQVEEAV